MNRDTSNVEDINIAHIKECLLLSCVASLRIGPASFALNHSPCARMIWILTTCLILRRCWSPYHRHQYKSVRVLCEQTGWLFNDRVSLFLLPSIHQISTLENTNSCQHSTLSNLMSERPQHVSLFLDATQSMSSEVIDFHIWVSLGFLVQQKQAHQESFRCVARLNSSSASILL